MPTNQSLHDHLNSSLYGFLISLTPVSDQERISPGNIVINTISTRYVIRMSKNVSKGITCWSNNNFLFIPHSRSRNHWAAQISDSQSITIYLPLFPNFGKWRQSFSFTSFSVIVLVNSISFLNCPRSGLFNRAISIVFGM